MAKTICIKPFDADDLSFELLQLVEEHYAATDLSDQTMVRLHYDLLNTISNMFFMGNISSHISETGPTNEEFMDIWMESKQILNDARKIVVGGEVKDSLSPDIEAYTFGFYISKTSKTFELTSEPADTPPIEKTEKQKRLEKSEGVGGDTTLAVIGNAPDNTIKIDVINDEDDVVKFLGDERTAPTVMPQRGKPLQKVFRKNAADMSKEDQDDSITLFKHIVSQSFVDTEVTSEGTTGGLYVPIDHINRIKESLSDLVYASYKERAEMLFTLSTKMDSTSMVTDFPMIQQLIEELGGEDVSQYKLKYEIPVFSKENLPPHMKLQYQIRDNKGVVVAEVFAHKKIRHPRGLNGLLTVIAIPGFKFDSISGMTNVETEAFAYSIKAELDRVFFSKTDVTITTLKPEFITVREDYAYKYMTPVHAERVTRMATIILDNLGSYIAETFPSLYGKSGPTHRNDYDEGSISQEAQESQRLLFTKETTPRLVFNEKTNTFTQDIKNPFLTTHEFDSIAHELSQYGTTTADIIKFIKGRRVSTKENKRHFVYTSIYQRYFSPEDYVVKVYDPILGTHKPKSAVMRSLSSIALAEGTNPITLEEYTKLDLDSMTEIREARTNRNGKLDDLVTALASSLSTNSESERLISRGDTITITNTRDGEVRNKFYSNLEGNIGHLRSDGNLYLKDDMVRVLNSPYFLDTKDLGEGKMAFTMYISKTEEVTDVIVFEFKLNSTQDKKVTGIPVKLLAIKSGTEGGFQTSIKSLDRSVLRRLMSRFGIPGAYLRNRFLDSFAENLKNTMNRDFFNSQLPLESFFINFLYLHAHYSATDGRVYGHAYLRNESVRPLWGFEQAIVDTLEPIEGTGAKKTSLTNTGKVHYNRGPVNALIRTPQKIEQIQKEGKEHMVFGDPELRIGSWITSGRISLDSLNAKSGIFVGDIAKSNERMTELEHFQYLIDQGMWQRADMTSFKNIMTQIGVMADRARVDMANLKSEGEYEFFPKTGETLDTSILMNQFLESQSSSHAFIKRNIIKKWKDPQVKRFYPNIEWDSIWSLADLKRAIDDNPVPYAELRKNTHIPQNIGLIKGTDGMATITENIVNGESLFRSQEEVEALIVWREEILPYLHVPQFVRDDIYTIEDIIYLLKDHEIPYKTIKELAKSSTIQADNLIKILGVVLDDDGNAIISPNRYHRMRTLKDNKVVHTAMEDSLEQFKEYVQKAGFVPSKLHSKLVRQVMHYFKGSPTSDKAADKKYVHNVLLTAYFYNQNTLGDELLRIQTGTTYQYKPTISGIDEAPTGDNKNLFHINKVTKVEHDPFKGEVIRVTNVEEILDRARGVLLDTNPEYRRVEIERLRDRKNIKAVIDKNTASGLIHKRVDSLENAGFLDNINGKNIFLADHGGSQFMVMKRINGVNVFFQQFEREWRPVVGSFGLGPITTPMGISVPENRKGLKGYGVPEVQRTTAALNESLNPADIGMLTLGSHIQAGINVAFDRDITDGDLDILMNGKAVNDATKAFEAFIASLGIDVDKIATPMETAMITQEILDLDKVGQEDEKELTDAFFGRLHASLPSLDEMSKRFKDNDRMIWIWQVMHAVDVKPEEKADILLLDQMSSLNTLGWIEQSKRNAGPGSVGQALNLVASNEIGIKMGLYSNIALHADPEEIVKEVIGTSKLNGLDTYDAVMFGEPAGIIKFNNSLGNDESNFITQGGAIKDVHTATQYGGVYMYNKRAVFPFWSEEGLKKGTPEMNRRLKYMYTAITWTDRDSTTGEFVIGRELMVPKMFNNKGKPDKDAPYNTIITPAIWVKHGLSLDDVYSVELDKIVNSKSLLARVRNNPESKDAVIEGTPLSKLTPEQFHTMLENGMFKTNMIKKTFKNMYELWEYFGSVNNVNSFHDIVFTASYHAGGILQQPADVDLKRSTHPIREGWLELTGVGSAHKTGITILNDAAGFKNPFLPDSGYTSGDVERFFPIDNTNRLVILQSDHDPDTTQDKNKRMEELREDDLKKKGIALLTQSAGATVNQGRSNQEAFLANSALGVLTKKKNDLLKSKVYNLARTKATKEGWNDERITKLNTVMASYDLHSNIDDKDVWRNENLDEADLLLEAAEEFYIKTIRNSLDKRQDSSALEELLNHESVKEKFSFELSQVLPFTQQLIYARFNTASVKYRFPGGQYIASPVLHIFRLYDGGDAEGLTRDKLNKAAYGGELIFEEGNTNSPTYELQPITRDEHVEYLTMSDLVQGNQDNPYSAGTINVAEARQLIRKEYEALKPEEDFEKFFINRMKGYFKSRLNELGPIESPIDPATGKKKYYGGKALDWTAYVNKHGENLTDTDEFSAFKFSESIFNDFDSTRGRSLNDFGMYYFSEEYEKGPKDLLKIMAAAYYFSNHNYLRAGSKPKDRVDLLPGVELTPDLEENMQYQWSDPEYREFETWFEEKKKDKGVYNDLKNKVYMFLYNRQKLFNQMDSSVTMSNRALFESKVETKLADPTENWAVGDSEFMHPHMHAENFLVWEGDSLHEFLGMQKQPKIENLTTAGVFNIKDLMSTSFGPRVEKRDILDKSIDIAESYEFETRPEDLSHAVDVRWANRGEELLDEIEEAYINSEDPNKDVKLAAIILYRKRKLAQVKAIETKYAERTREWAYEVGLDDFGQLPSFDEEKSPILFDINNVIDNVLDKRKDYYVGEDLYNYYTKIFKELKLIKTNYYSSSRRQSEVQQIIAELTHRFLSDKAEILSNDLLTSLQFFTARIPAQGKQSATVGRIVAILDSYRNASFGPIMLQLITGGDFDIDKQNNMTYDYSTNGNFLDWTDYMDQESLVPSETILNANKKAIEQRIKDNFQAKLDKLRATDPDEAREYQKEILGHMQAAIDMEMERFSGATTNFIVYQLSKANKKPENAIEVNTPVEADMAGDLIRTKNYTLLTKEELSSKKNLLGTRLQETVNKWNPAMMTRYEKVNFDGKGGIGIFASQSKGLWVSTAATIMSSLSERENYARFRTQFSRDFDRLKKTALDNNNQKLDNRALQFIKVIDGKLVIKNLRFLANTEQYMPIDGEETLNHKIETIKAEIRNADDKTQVRLILQHTNELTRFDKMTVEGQAWEYLSQLLTAATDNAKLMILGRIGANNTTNSIIATMLMVGVELSDAVGLIQEIETYQDPSNERHAKNVRDVFNRVEKFRDTQVNRIEEVVASSVLTAINAINDERGAISKPSDFELLADPLRRLLPFVQLNEEFSIISNFSSINQGLKIPHNDAWRMLKKLEEDINNSALEWNQEQRKEVGVLDDALFKIGIERFVKDVKNITEKRGIESRDAKNRVYALIDNYNKLKKGLNVIYIMKNSPQMINFYSVLYDAQRELSYLSRTHIVLRQILENVSENEKIRSFMMNDQKIWSLMHHIYQVGIDMFYNLRKVYANEDLLPEATRSIKKRMPKLPNHIASLTYFVTDGAGTRRTRTTKFDLSKPTNPTGEVQGRFEFIQTMPLARDYMLTKEGYADNDFLLALTNQHSDIDYESQTSITLLRAPNPVTTERNVKRRQDIALDNIAITNKEFYQALWHYSLITTAGSYGRGSFASMMGPDAYLDYSHFLKLHMPQIEREILDKFNYDRIILNSPEVMHSYTTNKDKTDAILEKRSSSIPMGDFLDFDPEAMYADYGESDEDDSMHSDGYGWGHSVKESFLEKEKDNFEIDVWNEIKLEDIETGKAGKEEKIPNYFKSEETGIMYAWVNDLRTWIPISKIIPKIGIAFNVLSEDPKESRGADLGFEIKDGARTIYTVYRHISEDYMDEIIAGKIHLLKDKYMGRDTSLNTDTDYYLVKRGGTKNDFIIKGGADLHSLINRVNSNIILDGPKIVRQAIVGSRSQFEDIEVKLWKDENGNLYSTKGDRTSLDAYDISQIQKLDGGETVVYDDVYFDKLNKRLEKEKHDPFDLESLDVSYEGAKLSIIRSLLRQHYPKITKPQIDLIMTNKRNGTEGTVYGSIEDTVEEIFEEDTTSITKLNTLLNLRETVARKLGNEDFVLRVDKSVPMPPKRKLLRLHKQILMDPSIVSRTTMEQFNLFLNGIPTTGITMKKFLEDGIFKGDDYTMYTTGDGRVYIKDSLRAKLRREREKTRQFKIKQNWYVLTKKGVSLSYNGNHYITIDSNTEGPYSDQTVTMIAWKVKQEGDEEIYKEEKRIITPAILEKTFKGTSATKIWFVGLDPKLGFKNTLLEPGKEFEDDKGYKYTVKKAEPGPLINPTYALNDYLITMEKSDPSNPKAAVEESTLTLKIWAGPDGIITSSFGVRQSSKDENAHNLPFRVVGVPSVMGKDADKKVSKKFFMAFARGLSKLFPGHTFRVLSTLEIKNQYGIDATMKEAFVRNGEIIFNSDKASLNTPIHEFAHIYLQYLKWENPGLYYELIQYALDSPMYYTIKELYPHLDDDNLGEEILAEIINKKASGKLIERGIYNKIEKQLSGKTPFSRILDWFKSTFNKLFGIDKKKYKIELGDSFSDILTKIGDNIAYGETSMLAHFTKPTRDLVELSKQGAKIDIDKARNMLQAAGFIKYVC